MVSLLLAETRLLLECRLGTSLSASSRDMFVGLPSLNRGVLGWDNRYYRF